MLVLILAQWNWEHLGKFEEGNKDYPLFHNVKPNTMKVVVVHVFFQDVCLLEAGISLSEIEIYLASNT